MACCAEVSIAQDSLAFRTSKTEAITVDNRTFFKAKTLMASSSLGEAGVGITGCLDPLQNALYLCGRHRPDPDAIKLTTVNRGGDGAGRSDGLKKLHGSLGVVVAGERSRLNKVPRTDGSRGRDDDRSRCGWGNHGWRRRLNGRGGEGIIIGWGR